MKPKEIAKALGADRIVKLSRKRKGPIDWLSVPQELQQKPDKKQLVKNFKRITKMVKNECREM